MFYREKINGINIKLYAIALCRDGRAKGTFLHGLAIVRFIVIYIYIYIYMKMIR